MQQIECQSGNARSTASRSQEKIIQILESKDLDGNRVAAFKCLVGQENRDYYGKKLLLEQLCHRYAPDVLNMMSTEALEEIMTSSDQYDDQIREEAKVAYDDKVNKKPCDVLF